jgi:hypothetical protein
MEPTPLVHFYSVEEILLPVSHYSVREYPRSASPLRPLILYLERDGKSLDIRKPVPEREGYNVSGISRVKSFPTRQGRTNHFSTIHLKGLRSTWFRFSQ